MCLNTRHWENIYVVHPYIVIDWFDWYYRSSQRIGLLPAECDKKKFCVKYDYKYSDHGYDKKKVRFCVKYDYKTDSYYDDGKTQTSNSSGGAICEWPVHVHLYWHNENTTRDSLKMHWICFAYICSATLGVNGVFLSFWTGVLWWVPHPCHLQTTGGFYCDLYLCNLAHSETSWNVIVSATCLPPSMFYCGMFGTDYHFVVFVMLVCYKYACAKKHWMKWCPRWKCEGKNCSRVDLHFCKCSKFKQISEQESKQRCFPFM